MVNEAHANADDGISIELSYISTLKRFWFCLGMIDPYLN